MTIGFIVWRKGFLKVMGSLIQAALERGHRAVLLWDDSERKPGEAVSREDLAPWPGALAAVHRRGAGLEGAVRRAGLQALVAPSFHLLLREAGLEEEARRLRGEGVRLYSVDYAFETLTSAPEGYRLIDTTFYMSEFQRRLHWTVLAARFEAVGREADLAARSAVSGSTMLDQLALVDRAAARRRYGLAPDRPVVLLMSLKMTVDPQRRYVWGGGPRIGRALAAAVGGRARLVPDILRGNNPYRDLVEAVRRFCDRHGAALVVKSREKNRDPDFLGKLADVFVERDAEVFPYTSIQLMAVADLCLHFQSGAVLEAAFAGVPSLSVRVPQPHLAHYPGFEWSFGGAPGTLQNFPGVVWTVEYDGAAALLDRASLADFKVDAAARADYVEKFLGFDDTRSSHRVLDVIERAAGLSPAAGSAAARPAGGPGPSPHSPRPPAA